ncbi:MAG: hypothetical protein U9M98_01490 [Patescibacteria group bacterium]|nr:hypothetical protein [Patescibacteria group bacterium]
MSSDKNFNTRNSLPSPTKLSFDNFAQLLDKGQRKKLNKISHNPDRDLRKTVYLSSGGRFYKYINFMREFAYSLNYVPIHPIGTLDYYLSSVSHKNKKEEVVKDCFSLLEGCDELWVFGEERPLFDGKETSAHISNFPEGVLAEIYFWLAHKPDQPLRFVTWGDIGIPKYVDESNWHIFNSIGEKAELQSGKKLNYPVILGIIDLGSSTVKLYVCKVNKDGSAETVHKKSVYTNLVENFFEKKVLGELPRKRTLQAVEELLEEADSRGAVDVKLVGTGALRMAKNAEEFMSTIKQKTGLELEVLTGEDEARLVFEAVHESFAGVERPLAVLNVGGSTTRLVTSDPDGEIIKNVSFPLSVTDLNEKYYAEDIISATDYKKLVGEIEEVLDQKGIGKLEGDLLFIYTGGELDYMLITGFPLENSDYSRQHPKELSISALEKHAEKMRQMPKDELRSYMPSNPKWIDGAVVSNALGETIAKRVGAKTIIPSNKNVNDGIILTMFEE